MALSITDTAGVPTSAGGHGTEAFVVKRCAT
jgi:hypothetical protein